MMRGMHREGREMIEQGWEYNQITMFNLHLACYGWYEPTPSGCYVWVNHGQRLIFY
jgi:hypothetical protein